jgi:Na+/H+-dicarboxylate symporter
VNRNSAIAVGLVAGLALGLGAASGSPTLQDIAGTLAPVGTVFVSLVRMVVVPLVATTVFAGVVRLGDPRRLGRLGGITLAFFLVTMLIAVVMGMVVMKLALPFAALRIAPPEGERAAETLPGTVDFILSLVPTNIVDVASRGALLPLVVFSVVFGAAVATLPEAAQRSLTNLANAVAEAMIQLVHWILWTAPVGVFALAASTTAQSGWDMLKSLAVFVVAVLVGLVVFVAAVYLPSIRFLGGMPVGRFLRAATTPTMIGASATSSAAALPAMLDVAGRDLGVPPGIAGFVLSLGAAINRTGSALFQGATIVFLASLYGVTIPPAALVGTVFTTLVLAMTVAGVPSASLVTLAPVLASLGIPTAGLALLFGIDRIPDMARTGVHIIGHLGAAVVANNIVKEETPRT